MIQHLFPIPMYDSTINIDFKKLEKLSYEEKSNDPIGVTHSNNGYQTRDLVFKKYKFLFDEVSKHAEEYFACFKLKTKLAYQNSWINISNKGHYNTLHGHPSSLISGVLYIKVPKDAGNIVFENPLWWIEYMLPMGQLRELNPYNSSECFSIPQKGQILMFPSWLRHYVKQNNSHEDRISLSFNFGQTK